MSNYYYTDLDDFDFRYLKNTRYEKVYNELEVAKKLHKTDKGACCSKLRKVLEMIIFEVLEISGLKEEKRRNINGNLALIRDYIPSYLRIYDGDDILGEMHNVRKNGNEGSHYDDSSDIDMGKAAHTSWIAIKKICLWVSDFEDNYREYQEAERKRLEEEERKRKIEEEEWNRKVTDALKTAGKVVLALAGVAIAVLTGKRMSK